MNTPRPKVGLNCFAMLVALVAAPPVWAAGDPGVGGQVAQRWCAECHVARPNASGPVVQGPPSFAEMARNRTEDGLRAFLAKPHAPMPSIELSRADIENLIAYIETQR